VVVVIDPEMVFADWGLLDARDRDIDGFHDAGDPDAAELEDEVLTLWRDDLCEYRAAFEFTLTDVLKERGVTSGQIVTR
jgi:hypothetical protein